MNTNNFLLRVVASNLIVISSLYLWAAICFLCFRFSRLETNERFRNFLVNHFEFFAFRFSAKAQQQITRGDVTRAGARGWIMAALPAFSFASGIASLTAPGVLMAEAVLFFGGLMFAYSWYGMRSMRKLNIESFEHNSTTA